MPEEQNMLVCGENKKVEYLENDYGLQDQDLSRRPFQIAVWQASIGATFDVEGQENLFATVGGVVEVETNLSVSLFGDLSLSVGSGDLLPFCDWLIAITSIFQPEKGPGYIDGFLNASSTFPTGNLSGKVKALPPFDDVPEVEVGGGFVGFDVDFIGKNSSPPVMLDIDLLASIRDLSFADVVNSLSKAVKFVVGDGESQSVESCSGGLLGKDLVSYQIPSK